MSKNSILLPVFDDRKNRQVGYLLDGPIGIIADLLVHTNKGAIGEVIEDTYSKALLFPIKLPFLTGDEIKEIPPLEDIYEYEEILNKYRSQIRRDDYIKYEDNAGVMLQTYNPTSLWFINGNSTFLVGEEEFIARRGENRLIWVAKDSFTTVNKNGKIFSTTDLFSIKKARKTFHSILDVPLALIFTNLREVFSTF
ncbi:hypothetical protein EU534_00885 [Candidatus Heimdallarchaeota archaeon]|nr:MAG: hypothetical protein EU534_00885 [Candidatus Heimdallarchaeota archaeon]